MSRSLAVLALISLIGAGSAQAQTQESAPGPGTVEVTIIPGGGTFFTENNDSNSPSFGNYDLGGSATLNVTRHLGFEGEVSGLLGVSQSLDFVNGSVDAKTPHFLNYSGNVVVSAGRGSVVPYATAGLGGLTLFERAAVGVNDSTTFLTSNIGGGVKWYAGRWGLRGDYRFIAVQSKDDAPAFFGPETRYGHRVYGGVILNLVR
jgi:hypothetical protein